MRRSREAALAAVATLAIHSLLAWWTPSAGIFAKYSAAAELLLAGDLPRERLVDFSPLYLQLAVFAERLADDPVRLLLGLQLVLAALAVGAFHHLLRPRLGPTATGGACALLALDRRLLVYERILEPETLLLALLLGVLVLLDRAGPGAALAAGTLGAAALATRPTFLPLFLLAPLYFLAQERWRRREPADWLPSVAPGEWRRRSVLFLVPVLLGVALLMLRAERITGSYATPTMNPGTVFFEGHQPLSHGTSAVYPPLVLAMVRHAGDVPDSAHEHYRRVARAGRPGASVAEVNALWGGRARAYLLDHPREAVRRAVEKLGHAFHGFRWHDVPSAWRYEARLPIPLLPTSILSALALLGLLAEARRWRRALPFYLLAAAQLGVMVLFYVSERQRLVLLPALVYFAVAAVRAGLRLDGMPRRLGAGALAGLLSLALALPGDAMVDEAHQRRGQLALEPLLDDLRVGDDAGGKVSDGEEGDAALAARRAEVVRALASAPWYLDWMRPAWVRQEDHTLDELVADELAQRLDAAAPARRPPIRLDLGEVLLRIGETDAARRVLEPLAETGFRAYRGGRQPSDPRIYLARAEALGGNADEALDLLRRTLADVPGDPFALAERAAILPAGLERDEAVRLLDRYVGKPDRHWLLGRALRRHGRAEAAVAELRPLARSLPGLRDVHLHLALALGDAGEVDEAARAILRANRLHVEPVLEVRAVSEIATEWAAAHPDDPQIQVLAARILHQHGAFTAALGLLEALRDEAAGEVALSRRLDALASEIESDLDAARDNS